MTHRETQHHVPVIAAAAVGTGLVGAIAGLGFWAWRRHQRNSTTSHIIYSAVSKGLTSAVKGLNKKFAHLG